MDFISPKCGWTRLSPSDSGLGYPRSPGQEGLGSQVGSIWGLGYTSIQRGIKQGPVRQGSALQCSFWLLPPGDSEPCGKGGQGTAWGRDAPWGVLSEEGSGQGVSSTKQGVFQGALGQNPPPQVKCYFYRRGAPEKSNALGLERTCGLVCSAAGFWFLTGVNPEEKCLPGSVSWKRELWMERQI